MSSKQRRLDSNITLEGEQLEGVVDDVEDLQVLGYLTMYTSGADWNVLVPHDWLADRAAELGLPSWLVPNKPRPSSAYKRTIKRLKEDYLGTYTIRAPYNGMGNPTPHDVQVDLREGDGRYTWHVHASVFFEEEECGETGGMWVDHRLGYLTYSTEHKVLLPRQSDDLDDEDYLYPVWEDVSREALELFQEMQETLIGGDIRKMMYYTTRDYTSKVVSLRDGGAVYFFPAGMTDFLDSMSTLYDDINTQFKSEGVKMAVRTVPILDTEDQREWIQSRVEMALEDSVERVLDETFESFDEGKTADEVVKVMREALGDDIETAETYNALLEAEMTIEKVLERQRDSIDDDEKKDIIDRALAQTDIDQF